MDVPVASTGTQAADNSRRSEWLAFTQQSLRRQASPEIAARARRFFPENPPIIGAPSGLSLRVGQELARQVSQLGAFEDAIWLAGQLYRSGYMEEGACANALLERYHKRFTLADWPLFDGWIADFTCWGTTDSFCLKVTTHVMLREGPPVDWLWSWARAALIWKRRAALVSLMRNVRVARDIPLAFDLCDALLPDSADLVQKAIGWLLKETCKGDTSAVLHYLDTRSERLSRFVIRYARQGLR